jgi:hypothetical protein
MKVSTEIDNNFGYEKITQLVDNIPLTNEVKHVQSSRPSRAEWYFHERRENTYGIWADN